MPVIDVTKDLETRTLVITAAFSAPIERVWALYADPRQLERVWGPPSYPATFVEHTMAPGSRSTYYMTSPDGERYPGWWRIMSVDEPHRFTFDDGFAQDNFEDKPELPVGHNVYRFQSAGEGTTATYTSSYDSAADLQTVLDMGVEEGATLAINQIDDALSTASKAARRTP